MKKGYALIIGINKVDTTSYRGWDGSLSQPEADAILIKNRAEEYNFECKLLMTKDATKENVIAGIKDLALKAKEGDLVFIYYSGHGGQVRDRKPREEKDGLDETWCLYDGQLIDDELYRFWSDFQAGVRVFLVSDSCHSGTISKSMPLKPITSPNKEIKISVISYGGCQDSQSSYAYPHSELSLFTTHFIKTLNNPAINNSEHRIVGGYSYDKAMEYIKKAVHAEMGNKQTPTMNEIGSSNSFRNQILLQI